MAFKNLRTLTRKSQLKFGKYADLTVGELLNIKYKYYLRWVYYNCSMINYTEDILEELRIFEPDRIEKPGAMPEKYDELNDKVINKGAILPGLKAKNRLQKKKRLAQKTANRQYKRVESKKTLQARNQGKY